MPGRSSRQEHGPLQAGLADEFRVCLAGQGFSEDGTRRHLRLMRDLGEWLAARGLGPASMTGEAIDEFARDRRREGRGLWTPAGLAPLLGFLRDHAGAPAPETSAAPEPVSAEEKLLAGFERYLVSERALTPGSARVYSAAARAFAVYACLPGEGIRPLAAPQVTKFIIAESTRRSVRGTRMTVTAVRALLRWLHQCGTLPSDLSGAVPGVAPWSGRRAISPPSAGQVSAVLAACSQAPRTGARDYAIVLMLARYGLRKSEVAGLRLEDIDWHSGKVTIHGKRSHTDTLPLAADIGEALAACLAGRRPGPCRALFLTAKAPARPLAAATIDGVVRNACLRAGVPPFGPHRLRHFTGTGILEAGGTLAEAGQLLRHSRPATTSLYLTVSTTALRPLARPWSAGGAAS
jgi:integrase/recombinase XerD